MCPVPSSITCQQKSVLQSEESMEVSAGIASDDVPAAALSALLLAAAEKEM